MQRPKFDSGGWTELVDPSEKRGLKNIFNVFLLFLDSKYKVCPTGRQKVKREELEGA